MIVEGTGDLLAADVDALVNTVNCVGVMGKGIALQFKRRYPQMFKEYAQACKRGDVRIGQMYPVAVGEMNRPHWVINFPTKKHWRAGSQLSWIAEGLDDLRATVARLDISSIAIPPLGAGNGGLDWAQVEPLIRDAFADMPAVAVHLFAPTHAPRAVDAGHRQLRMTPGRALTIALMDQYAGLRSAVALIDTDGVSHLEVQKLLYFASLVRPVPKLQFVPAKYGPYADAVRHMIQDMEGSFTAGFGDGSGRVLDLEPIALTQLGADRLHDYLDKQDSGPVTDVVDRVMTVVDGYASPYGLELLATTHWVAANENAIDTDSAVKAVQRWSERKGRIFTHRHVESALMHLRRHDLVPTP